MSNVKTDHCAARVSQSHDLYLDWIRGIAAFLVFLTHLRGEYFVKWSDLAVDSQNFVNFVLFSLTRLGRESVVIFFVLSGYLVGGMAARQFLAARFSILRYFIARLTRLYVVLIPALFLTLLFDSLDSASTLANSGVVPFLINFFFLQEILGAPYGSNAPLWSLSYEWWYYCAFGFALVAISNAIAKRNGPMLVGTLLALAAFLIMSAPM